MIKKGTIVREDMLELTRRMNLNRNCFSRIAGAYFDEDGFVEGTFNRHFGRLTPAEQTKHLELAKAIPFAKTNIELVEYEFEEEEKKPGKLRQLLLALLECELKNDALLDIFYEMIGERERIGRAFGLFLFFGNYDVKRKASDQTELGESEEVYSFLVCAICPVDDDYNPEDPVKGCLFPAFKNRSGEPGRLEIFCKM